jgi:hypothetical protein
MNDAVRFRIFAHNLGIFMQPIESCAIGRIKRDIEENPSVCQPGFNRSTEVFEALPRQCRNDDRFVIRRQLGAGSRCREAGVIQKIALVPDLHEAAVIGGIDSKTGKYSFDVAPLRFGVFMRNIADMQNEISFKDFLERRTEGLDKHCRQVGDKANRIGQNDLTAMWKRYPAQSWIEGRKKHVFGDNRGLRQPIEESGFSRVRIADERDNRIRNRAAALAV